MRIPTAIIFTLTLTACGDGSSIDESVKTRIRQQLIATCTVSAEAQIPEGVTVDLDKLCTCAADKVMAGKSAKELITNPPTSAEDLSVVQECVKEVGPVKIDTSG